MSSSPHSDWNPFPATHCRTEPSSQRPLLPAPDFLDIARRLQTWFCLQNLAWICSAEMFFLVLFIWYYNSNILIKGKATQSVCIISLHSVSPKPHQQKYQYFARGWGGNGVRSWEHTSFLPSIWGPMAPFVIYYQGALQFLNFLATVKTVHK